VSAVEVGGRLGRSYTRARRMPWLQGKLGDWVLPFGPYTAAQIGVAFVGTFLLVKTFSVWRPLGVVPPVLLVVAVWGARHAKIGGQSPFSYVWGLAARLAQPPGGRIGGRPVRVARPLMLRGGVIVESGVVPGAVAGVGGRAREAAAARGGAVRGGSAAQGAVRSGPAPTEMQRLLRRACEGRAGGRGARGRS
jgi:hypothetical protein